MPRIITISPPLPAIYLFFMRISCLLLMMPLSLMLPHASRYDLLIFR